MFEHSKTKLASKKVFRHRMLKFSIISASIFIISLFIGILGYHLLAELGWVDSFLNASMILGGMGPVDMLKSDSAKLFAGFYSLFSGVAFLSSMALFLTPILHRFLHKFHLDMDEEDKTKK
jgi:hypothetical protein